MKKRWSKIYACSTEELQAVVARSSSLTEVLSHLGFQNKGGHFLTLKRRLREEKIDYSHIPLGVGANKGMPGRSGRNFIEIPNEECFIENSTLSTKNIKRKIFKFNLLPNQCALCDDPPFWKGKPLVLILDHINGVNTDNRLENLQLVCPNCNSQTDTFCGRNHKK